MTKRSSPNLESWFVQLRLEAGLTQQQIADAFGVSTQAVRNWEQGKNEPRFTLSEIKLLCSLLGKKLDELPDKFSQN